MQVPYKNLHGFPFLPSFDFEQERLVAHLYGYCDESGKQEQHPVVVFNGLVDAFEPLYSFAQKWTQLLTDHELTGFHTVEALRHSQPYGIMQPGTPEDRTRDVLPFLRAIIEGVSFGIIAAVDVRAYKAPAYQLIREKFGDDPHYFAFYLAISEILRHWGINKNLTIGLCLDDDESKAIQCYKFYRKMRMSNADARQRITSICFSDDKSSPQVQAADFLCYLTRTETEKRFFNKEYPYQSLFNELNAPPEGNRRLSFRGGFYSHKELSEYMDIHIRPFVKGQ